MKDLSLDMFLERIFENLTEKDNINKIKETVKENIENYNDVKVEFQVLTSNNNYELSLNISSESYKDEEVMFIDLKIEN